MVFTTMIIHTNTQKSTAMMLMTMTMIIHSYQLQSYSSDANHTLHCNECMTTDHDIINTM